MRSVPCPRWPVLLLSLLPAIHSAEAAVTPASKPRVLSHAAKRPNAASRRLLREPGDPAIVKDLKTMLDPALRGREPGLPEYRKIAAYGADQLAAAGIQPLKNEGTGAERYFHAFHWAAGPFDPGGSSVNVVGVRPGTDNTKRATLVIAHLDHIEGFGGANDNASGSATLLAIARKLQGTQLKKNVIFMLSSAEEKGLIGTAAFARDKVAEKAGYKIDEVLAYDMVGAGPTRQLQVFGGTNAQNAEANRVYRQIMTDGKKQQLDMQPGHEHDGGEDIFRRSDHWVYAAKGYATSLVTSGLIGPYHSPEDTFEKLNLPKLSVATDLGAANVTSFANAYPDGQSLKRLALSPHGLRTKLGKPFQGLLRAEPTAMRYRQMTPDGDYLVDLVGKRSVQSMVMDPVSGEMHRIAAANQSDSGDAALRKLSTERRLPRGADATVRGLSRSGENWHIKIQKKDGTVENVMLNRYTGEVSKDTAPKRFID